MTKFSHIATLILASAAVLIASSCKDSRVETIDPDRQPATKNNAPAGLHEMGYRSITIGSIVEDTALSIQRSDHPGAGECDYARLNNDDGILFMVVEDTVVRIDVFDDRHRLPNGLSIGSAAMDIEAAYGSRVVIEPHKYDDNSNVYKVKLSNETGLVFEVNGAEVARYRIGRYPEVEWVEGCL